MLTWLFSFHTLRCLADQDITTNLTRSYHASDCSPPGRPSAQVPSRPYDKPLERESTASSPCALDVGDGQPSTRHIGVQDGLLLLGFVSDPREFVGALDEVLSQLLDQLEGRLVVRHMSGSLFSATQCRIPLFLQPHA